ncbi:MAG: hypothetical protein RIR91_905 [Verrucomicrobiota bacterium]|jgi:Domain of unknown function (DUF4337)
MSEAKKPEATPAAPAPDAWTKWVALSTTLLAVAAAFSTLKGGSFSTQTQLATVSASNKWSYFQSKSLKQTARETEREIITVVAAGAANPEAKAVALASVAKIEKEIKRYDEEKAAIKLEAETLDAKASYNQARGGNFGMAVMFLQIAIMLSAIAALMKKKSFWLIGLVTGAVGVGYLTYAWALYPEFAPPAAKVAATSK